MNIGINKCCLSSIEQALKGDDVSVFGVMSWIVSNLYFVIYNG